MKIHYRIKNNAIEIVRCYGTDDRIVLPEEINGLPVVSAAPYAFSAHKDGEEDAETWESEDVISFGEERLLAGEEVQEIVFPDTLKEIGRYIFYGCKRLERLEFSDTLMQVGTGALITENRMPIAGNILSAIKSEGTSLLYKSPILAISP